MLQRLQRQNLRWQPLQKKNLLLDLNVSIENVVEVLVQQGDIKSTKVVVSVDYKALLDIEIKPIVSEEERELLAQACQEKGGVYPIFPTHFVRKGNEIVGCFSIYSPTVVFQACDTLMTEQGYHSYILPCEPESPYFSLLSKRLNTIQTKEGDDFKLFLNKG
jgi:hypothetical protein